MAEDGFHEIQLNGKQLVFLFMATTVVAVVIFLLGVMVGRGVKAEKGAATVTEADVAPQTQPIAAPSSGAPAPAPSAATGSAAGGPAQPNKEDLSYYSRLEGDKPPVETLKQQPATSPVSETPPPPPAEVPAQNSAAVTSPGEPAGEGLAVQVAALREPGEADAIVKRLVGKGYSAYVVAPAPGGAPVYRVRVGKFKSRAEAENVKRRLEKEEQFKPWIIR